MQPAIIKNPEQREIVKSALKNPLASVRSLIKNNLYLFLQYFWPVYSQTSFQPNWHIEYICKQLEKVARRVANNETNPYDLIINVPPGSTKTAIVSIMYPIWCWTNWIDMKFNTVSYTAPLALESAEYSRDIVRSELFKMMFPEIEIKEDKDTKSNFRVVKKIQWRQNSVPRIIQGGNRFSTSVGGSLTGFHGHINIVDDPIDPMQTISAAELKKANHWMDNVLPMRKIDKRVTATILIMQRLHQDDPTGHLLKLRPESIKHICIPGEIRNYITKVQPQSLVPYYRNDLMDPVRLDWDALHKIEQLGQFTYGGQIGQDPVPLGGGMFKTDHFQIIDQAPHLIKVIQTVRYWDKAGTAGGDGAFTAGVKMARLKDGRFVVMDVKRGRWSSEERERIIKETAANDGISCSVFVEQEPGSGGKESAESTIKNLAGHSVYKDRPTGNKVLRADPFSVQVNEGVVMLLNAVWNKDYIDELKNFPNSTFKDQTDASSGAFAKICGLKKVKVGSS